MNSYERVMTALELGEPDCVPIVETALSMNVIKALCPEAKDRNDFEEAMGLDGVWAVVQFNKVGSNPDGTYMDEWGVVYKPSPEVQDHPIMGPIETLEDLKKYVPHDPDVPHRLGKLAQLVARYKHRKAIFFVHRTAFMWSVFLNGSTIC